MGSEGLYRLQRFLHKKGLTRIARFLRRLNIIVNSVDIGLQTEIGKNFTIYHGLGLVIGDAVRIGDHFTCFQGVTLGTRNIDLVLNDVKERAPSIGSRVTVYTGAVIIGPVEVGDNAIIGANAVILSDVPPGTKVPAGAVWRGRT